MSRPRSAGSAWSVQVATIAGIPVRVHFTFLVLVAWFALESRRGGNDPALAVALLLLLFACVVLHELGHAFAARRYGVRTSEIVLYPIGGIARLERLPSGRAELVIALAGPAVNALLAAALLGALALAGGPVLPAGPLVAPHELPRWLLQLNVLLVVFNLLPAFPMDGGRVLRASLALFLPQDRATGIATTVGQAVAILFVVAGILTGQVLLMIVALFVFLGAAQEALFCRQRATIVGRTARAAMITRFETLAPGDSLQRAAELLLASHQHEFPVLDAWGRVAGALDRGALFQGLTRLGADAAVLEVMRRDVARVSPDTGLDRVLELLREDPSRAVLVLDDAERLAGMITLENVTEFVEIARRTSREGAPAGAPRG